MGLRIGGEIDGEFKGEGTGSERERGRGEVEIGNWIADLQICLASRSDFLVKYACAHPSLSLDNYLPTSSASTSWQCSWGSDNRSSTRTGKSLTILQVAVKKSLIVVLLNTVNAPMRYNLQLQVAVEKLRHSCCLLVTSSGFSSFAARHFRHFVVVFDTDIL